MFGSFLIWGIVGINEGITPPKNSAFLNIGIIFVIIAPIILLVNIKMLSEKMEITPEGITWEGGFIRREIKFNEIKNIRYYKETTIQGGTPLDTDIQARFYLKNGNLSSPLLQIYSIHHDKSLS